jgi:hypothetical protein
MELCSEAEARNGALFLCGGVFLSPDKEICGIVVYDDFERS